MLSRRTRMVLAVLIVASLTFIILDLRGGQGPLGGLRSFGANIIGGLERVAATVFSPVTGASSWWSDMRDQAAQIQTLRSENSTLRGDLTTLQSDKARADALDALLRVSSVGDYRFVPAEVVAVGPAQDFAWTVTVDAGRNDGVENDMSVINGDGLVGHVVKTTSGTATVMLVTDAESSVGARIAGSEEIGVVSGTGDQHSLDFQLLDPMADVRVGDALVTFGSKSGRPYAPGLPIGRIVSVSGSAGDLTRVAKVEPFVDVSTLSVVGVVTRPPRTDPRDSVLGKGQQLDSSSSPAPLGGTGTGGNTGSTPESTPTSSAANEVEQPASRAPSSGGG